MKKIITEKVEEILKQPALEKDWSDLMESLREPNPFYQPFRTIKEAIDLFKSRMRLGDSAEYTDLIKCYYLEKEEKFNKETNDLFFSEMVNAEDNTRRFYLLDRLATEIAFEEFKRRLVKAALELNLL